jgi:hypothetical protein
VSARQVTISVTAEGSGDLHALPTLVERAATDVVRRAPRLDADVLPPLRSVRPVGASFPDWLAQVERRDRADLFIVHQDSDKQDPLRILEGRWASWLGRATDAHRWVLAVPVRTTEAWILADHETLASVIAMPHPGVVDRIGRRSGTDAVRQPKQVVSDLLDGAGVAHGWTVRYETVASTGAERASLARITQRSRSYRTFAQRLAAALGTALVGRPGA